MAEPTYSSAWNRFWHAPLRAERLALMRVLLGVALLTQLMFEYLPNLNEFYGPGGTAPAGVMDEAQLDHWFWTILIFNTDDMVVVRSVFACWVVATIAFTLGFWTRLMTVAVWLLTMAFVARNSFLQDGGDDALQIPLFLLVLSPSGRAFALDAWLRRRRGLELGPAFTSAWPVRLIQIQLCVIYGTTGLAKLQWLGSTWWDGTSIHIVLNYITMSRFSYASLPVPIWITAPMTWMCVWWEALFPGLVFFERTRKWTLLVGVLFHLGIALTLAIGWFSFYMLAPYAVWIPDSWWEHWCRATAAS